MLGTLAERASQIFGVLGAICGLLVAFDESYGLVGYVVCAIVGAIAVGVVGAFMVYGLALAAGAGVLPLVLKACGAA